MKTSKHYVFRIAVLILISTFVFQSCEKISQGLQRKQFEFLYKINNYASLFREYTGGIAFYSDLKFYENRMDKLYEDVSRIEPIEGYQNSESLKSKFLSTINENLNSVHSLMQKQKPSSENIRSEFEVIKMNERVDEYTEELNKEIIKIGKQ